MKESKYYDGTKLLSLKDINGQTPEIYIVTTNRTGGKTTYFGRLCINRFLQTGSKFAILYRYNYEVDDIANTFYKDIGTLFFEGQEMTSKRMLKGMYHELFLNNKSCGYALSLNSAEQIKRKSHLFNDVDRMIFDEFQSETNHYAPNEVAKFQSIHTSIARGQGKQVRYVPVYMLSNPVSIINPYYVKFGISSRLRDDVKFLRGDGFVLEQGFVKSASLAQSESGFNRAFNTLGNDKYVAYASQSVYLNDTKSFIDTPKGRSRYICTLKYMDTDYAIREYSDLGIMYVDTRVDSTFKNRISVTTSDHDINYVMLQRNDFFLGVLRTLFERGCFRFKDLKCKDAILSALSY